ncbi:MAG TPA: SBBP repeat-containing protein [Herpetosiphonaceae bacterium]
MTYIRYPRLRESLPFSQRPLFGALTLLMILSVVLGNQPGSSLATPLPGVEPAAITHALAGRPLAFIPNVGQSSSDVQFQAEGLGGMIFFNRDHILLSLPASSAASASDSHKPLMAMAAQQQITAEDQQPEPMHTVQLRFVGASTAPQIQGLERLPGIVNYMVGSDPDQWHTHVPTYAGISYQQLYPGIDLRYDGDDGRLKGTYMVAAGTDPRRIRWRYEGATAPRVDDQGNLILTLATGDGRASALTTLTEQAPVAWQTVAGRDIPVMVRYDVAPDNTIGFTLGAYDPTQPLVIDPTLDYSTFIGGNGDDAGRSIAVDSTGAVYITGETTSNNMGPAGSYKGGKDIFVSRLSRMDRPGGQIVEYTTYLGGSNTDISTGIAVDSAGNAYIVGTTNSTNFANAGNTNSGGNDAVVAILTNTGVISYSAYLGGSRSESGNGIAISSDKIYVAGLTESSNFPMTGTNPTPFPDIQLGGSADGFIVRVDKATRTLDYSTYLGGTSSDVINSIAVDSSNDIYVTGYTTSSDYPIRSAVYPVFGGSVDAFLTRLASDGRSLVYSTYLGGSGFDYGNSIAVGPQGEPYVTGYTSSKDMQIINGYQSTLKGGYDAFLVKLYSDGFPVDYSTYLGGSSGDYAKDVVVGEQGAAYIIGSTESSDFVIQNGLLSRRNGSSDAFVTKFVPSGSGIEYSTFFGGTNNDYGEGIAIQCQGATPFTPPCSLYITGLTDSENFPAVSGSWKTDYSGGSHDAFVAKLDPLSSNTRIFLDPPIQFVGQNQQFSVDISINTGGKSSDTVDAYLKFDPTKLEAVSVMTATNALVRTIGEFDNEAGRVDFSATKLNSPQNGYLPEGNLRVATVQLRSLNTASAGEPLNISLVAEGARQSTLYLAGKPISTAVSNANIRIVDGSILNGKISFAGDVRGTPPNPGWITPLYRTVGNNVQKEIIVYSRGLEQIKGSADAITNEAGEFSVFLKGIPADRYSVRVKGGDTLSNIRQVDLATMDQVDFGSLAVGDSTGDNMINGGDVSYMVPAFGLDTTNPQFRAYGDTNKDGQIDRPDVVTLKENFLKTGVVSDTGCLNAACAPPAPSPASVGIAATERPTLMLLPETLSVETGEVFTVSLEVDLKSQRADTIDAFLTIENPGTLSFIDKAGNLIEAAYVKGEIDFSTAVLGNSSCETTYNNTLYRAANQVEANLSVTCYQEPFLPDRFTLAQFRVKANKQAEAATITLEKGKLLTAVRTSDLYLGGVSLNPTRNKVTVEIKGSRAYLPVAGS